MKKTTLVSRDGVRIAAETIGEGPITFVIAHGITGGRHKPGVRKVATWFAQYGRVVIFDQRGHGQSRGWCTLGYREPLDLDVACAWARELSDAPVVTVGFSMGAAVAVRHAAIASAPEQVTPKDAPIVLHERPDATVLVSGVSEWFFRGTQVMDRLFRLSATPWGRFTLFAWQRVRLSVRDWGGDPNAPAHALPTAPTAAAALIAHPLLVVSGDRDHYFPPEHGARQQEAAAAAGNARADFWLERDMGHAEYATTEKLVARIAEWSKRSLLS